MRWTGGADRGAAQEVCRCFSRTARYPRARVGFHRERQDLSAPGWLRLLELVDEAVEDGREEFRPLAELSPEERRQVVTLPPSIAGLTSVRHLVLYGSNLVRLPPEIGAMTALEEFTPVHLGPAALVPVRDHPLHAAGAQHGEHACTVRQPQVPSAVPPGCGRSGTPSEWT
ncbi:hypothetical protein GCM10020229_46960 [Kitasatospora albolonga]